jgi:hypothetical protein
MHPMGALINPSLPHLAPHNSAAAPPPRLQNHPPAPAHQLIPGRQPRRPSPDHHHLENLVPNFPDFLFLEVVESGDVVGGADSGVV